MSAAKPAIPPQIAVITRPRNGSSSFNASRAPATAPKKEAAHARKGVRSHPKIRKNRRSQRMGSGSAFPARGYDGGENQTGEKRDCEGSQRPGGSGESEEYGQHRDHNGEHERY